MKNKNFDIIIIGGSYAGLSAALTLARALRRVLIIDSGRPCNAQAKHSHNFLTHDGKPPSEISKLAKMQIQKYDTVEFYEGTAIKGKRTNEGFEILTAENMTFVGKKLIFATGVKNRMPIINGFAESWGISILHCPYCHGYEVRGKNTAIFGNGEFGFHLSKMIFNWTNNLTLFTNGPSTLTDEQTQKIKKHEIRIIEGEIEKIRQSQGMVQEIVLKNGSQHKIEVMYAHPEFEQHCDIPEKIGCEITEQGFIKIDMFQKTSVPGIFACGDNTTPLRTISNAVAQGTLAGAMSNMQIIEEEF